MRFSLDLGLNSDAQASIPFCVLYFLWRENEFLFSHKLIASASAIVLSGYCVSPAVAVENDLISNDVVQKIVEENTLSPASITNQKWIEANDEIDIQEVDEIQQTNEVVSEQAEILTTTGKRFAQVIDREDGRQIITLSPGDHDQEFRFNFEGAFLEEKDGYILVRPEQFEEPYQIIDPAWAQDTNGEKVDTHYEIVGDTLVQHVNASATGTPVVADPYIRDVYGWGKKTGQELVFTKDETSMVAIGASYCTGKVTGMGLGPWIVKGACAGASAVATHAANTGRCFTIRALGGKYSPNIVFPYATRC